MACASLSGLTFEGVCIPRSAEAYGRLDPMDGADVA